ncbi:MAG: ompA [Bacteroidetes bacterium]|nr:MAG: ompA [Bacteroidota bacterium]
MQTAKSKQIGLWKKELPFAICFLLFIKYKMQTATRDKMNTGKRKLLFAFCFLPFHLNIRHFALLLLLVVPDAVSAAPVSEADLQKKADILYNRREYELAYDYYLRLKSIQPAKLLYEFRAGVCAIYSGDAVTALGFLKGCIEKDTALTDIHFFLGRAYLLNNKPDEARTYFMKQASKETDEAQRKKLQYWVYYCNNAIEQMAKPVNANVQNAGRPVNTPGDEFAPVLMPDNMGMWFTYKGTQSTGGKMRVFGRNDSAGYYLEDVLDCRMTNNGWSIPLPLSDSVNTAKHDACTAVSPDGLHLYIYRSSPKDGGDIYVCHKRGLDWSRPEKILGEINTPAWEGSISFAADGKTAYFASEREGGYGGKDIYRSTLKDDGTWGNIENLGPNINTEMDDDAPFLFEEGKRMSYASKGQNSIGGYDIFISELLPDGKTWKEGVTIGYPVNSTMDDIYYAPNPDGFSAYLCSNRAGGNGGMDIYISEPGMPAKAGDLVLIKGIVTLDDLPAAAAVSVTAGGKDSLVGDYRSNGASGRYAVSLPPGNDYKVTFIMSGCIDSVKSFNASDVSSFVAKSFDVAFYSAEYKRVHYERFGVKDTSTFTKKLLFLSGDEITLPNGEKTVVRRDSSKTYQDEKGQTMGQGMFIVIGSFKNAPYAKRLQAKIKNDKVYPAHDLVYNRENGFTYVVVARPKSTEEAADWVTRARKEYRDAWIQQLE